MKILQFIFIALLFSSCSPHLSYFSYTPSNNSQKALRTKTNCDVSTSFKDYYERYEYFASLYEKKNEVVIPLTFHIWQKEDGTKNYIDISENRKELEKAIYYLDGIYQKINAPLPVIEGVVPLPSTKIRFVLKGIFFHQNTTYWKFGQKLSPEEGFTLNNMADQLSPEGINTFKIHYTTAQPKASGFSIFPTYDLNTEHFVVTFNGEEKEIFDPAATWTLAQHLAHEIGHSLDLRHTYKIGGEECNPNNPDYLDDVYGKGEDAVCPHLTDWVCNFDDPNAACDNNIMGGTKHSSYFSPKQVYRMHRALAYKSIRKYALVNDFKESEFIDISEDQIWDFNYKVYNHIRIKKGATLTLKCQLELIEEAGIYIEKGGQLILDGGIISGNQTTGNSWKGIFLEDKNKENIQEEEYIEILNHGSILY